MKKIILVMLMLASTTVMQSQEAQKDFVKGADVGFLAGQERRGVQFHDREGRERECLELLKNDYGMSAIRLRVWVNPRGGDCGKEQVLAMAQRVKALGMDLMIDFHYADSWADPAKQPIPAAWKDHSYKQMLKDVKQHTVEVLTLLKQNGIEPRWVQVGNETANGLLWPMGHIEKNPKQYAGFIRAGYDAVKKILPKTQVIIHLDRGHKQSLYDWNLDIVKKYGGKWDMIGMSLYPYWALNDNENKAKDLKEYSKKADQIITDCMANIRHVSQKYGCDVMIVETGYEVDETHPEVMEEGRRELARVLHEARTQTNGRCRGVFYWEPQCLPGGYKLGAFDSKAAPTAIMEAFTERPYVPRKPRRQSMDWFESVKSPEVKANGDVTFRLFAPQAKEVQLNGQWGPTVPMAWDDDEQVWKVTVHPEVADIYPYNFVVDGQAVNDPANKDLFPNELFKGSLLLMPNEAMPYTERDIPHGKVTYCTYYSSVLKELRTMLVYTPADYEASARTKYPVLYLVSGTTDTEETWFKAGRTNFILDNLIHEGKAKKMIVVMPYGNMNTGNPRPSSDAATKCYEIFSQEMQQCVMPYVEKNFRTLTDRNHRAIAGFSRGGGEALYTAFKLEDKFAYVCAYAAYLTNEVYNQHFSDLVGNPTRMNQRYPLIWFGVGSEDFLHDAVKQNEAFFTERGIRHEAFDTTGGHTWMNARKYLNLTLPKMFR